MRTLIRPLLLLPFVIVLWHTLVRLIRRFYKFPIPQVLADLIDNPLRRRLQPPQETAIRHGIEPGTKVLEIGPGNGRYTVAAAQRAGPAGQVVALDIEPRMLERVRQRAETLDVPNIRLLVASAHDLPFAAGHFDRATMIAVMGEIPQPTRALVEIRRVLKPAGRLACSELFFDPDYPRAATLARWAEAAGWRQEQQLGNWLYYTLILTPERPKETRL